MLGGTFNEAYSKMGQTMCEGNRAKQEGAASLLTVIEPIVEKAVKREIHDLGLELRTVDKKAAVPKHDGGSANNQQEHQQTLQLLERCVLSPSAESDCQQAFKATNKSGELSLVEAELGATVQALHRLVSPTARAAGVPVKSRAKRASDTITGTWWGRLQSIALIGVSVCAVLLGFDKKLHLVHGGPRCHLSHGYSAILLALCFLVIIQAVADLAHNKQASTVSFYHLTTKN
jgi:hypothetical protein